MDARAAAWAIIQAVGECIRDLTELKGGVPSGELYAQLCGKMDLDTYNDIIRYLINSGDVWESGHYLTWIGKRK